MAFVVEDMSSGNPAIVASAQALWRPPSTRENWTRRRFGMWTHFAVTSAAAMASTPRIYMGFCNDAGGGPGSATCGHFVGVRSNASAWSYTADTGTAYLYTSSTAANLQRVIIVDGTPTASSFSSFGSWNHGAIHNSTADAYRLFTIIEATRTSATQLQLAMFYTRFDNGPNIAADMALMSNAKFLQIMESELPLSDLTDGFSVNTVASTNGPFTINEADDGVLDAVAFSMDDGADLLAGRFIVASEA
jgi:hypothetical protein